LQHGIYLIGDGRINITGLSEEGVDQVTKVIAKHS